MMGFKTHQVLFIAVLLYLPLFIILANDYGKHLDHGNGVFFTKEHARTQAEQLNVPLRDSWLGLGENQLFNISLFS